MITSGINFKNFNIIKKSNLVKKKLKLILKENNAVIKSLSKNYRDSFSFKDIKKYKALSDFRIIGMGGSSLGAQAIYNFLKKNIKKKFVFFDNLNSFQDLKKGGKFTNLIVSKSGNTLETILNVNILISRNDENIFITENKSSYLFNLAQKLKAEIVHHNNFIGGRYSVLSEVGMLPAKLMGLNPKKFRQFDNLIKNKNFLNLLVRNTGAIFNCVKQKKSNSIIINYDHQSDYLFQWYQQLVAESLGKKGKGILPFISTMPKDNHSLMQFYLDGSKNNFFTLFFCKDKVSNKINKDKLFKSHKYLGQYNSNDIIFRQKNATENVFAKKNIPFRSFEIKKRDEKTLGELFCYFILETILLGRMLNVSPFDQPSVELIKKETHKQF